MLDMDYKITRMMSSGQRLCIGMGGYQSFMRHDHVVKENCHICILKEMHYEIRSHQCKRKGVIIIEGVPYCTFHGNKELKAMEREKRMNEESNRIMDEGIS